MPGGDQVLPFVRLFYDRQSTYLWEDDAGTVHHIVQGEGGEQGDPLMPLLFALRQHAVQNTLGPTERLLAFLDDVYTVTTPERVAHSFATLQEHLHRHANIRVHLGKIKVWNASGVRPRACDTLQAIATNARSFEPVWKGSGCPLLSKGSRCSEPRWDTRISWRLIFSGCWASTRHSWNASQVCRTSRARGLCCCTVLPVGRISSCGW